MYLKRLSQTQAQLQAYQEKTRNLEVSWRLPMPVPTAQRSRQHDFYFTFGRFEVDGPGQKVIYLAVFTANPRRRLNLHDPHGFMMLQAPCGSVDDFLVIFNTHIGDADMGRLKIGYGKEDRILIVKGVESQVPGTEEEAEHFTFCVNKEILTLFLLAQRTAQAQSLFETELELGRIMTLESGK